MIKFWLLGFKELLGWLSRKLLKAELFCSSFSLPAAWNADVKTEIPAAFLDHGVPFSRENVLENSKPIS